MPARTLCWGPPPGRKSQAVAQRWPPTGRSCRERPLRKGSPEISQPFLIISLPNRIVISLTFLTDSGEMGALPILIEALPPPRRPEFDKRSGRLNSDIACSLV